MIQFFEDGMINSCASVSVVIPCYRCSHTVIRAVESIAKQTLLPAEVILVDDCSGDETLQTLYHLQALYPDGWIKVISLPANDGPGTARNAGWDISKETYVAFLDADDSWHRQKIEIQYMWMLKHPEASLTGHNYVLVEDGCKNMLDLNLVNDPVLINKNQLFFQNRFPTRTVMLRKDINYRFEVGKRYAEDYLLWLQICVNQHSCFKFSENLAFAYKASFGEGGLSANLWRMEQGELNCYLKLYKGNFLKLHQYVFFAVFSVIKYLRRLVISCWSRHYLWGATNEKSR